MYLLFAVHRRLLLQMALTNPDADPKGGTALARDDIPELVKAVVEAVKAQTQPPLISAGSKDATPGTSANTGEPHVKPNNGAPGSIAHYFS